MVKEAYVSYRPLIENAHENHFETMNFGEKRTFDGVKIPYVQIMVIPAITTDIVKKIRFGSVKI